MVMEIENNGYWKRYLDLITPKNVFWVTIALVILSVLTYTSYQDYLLFHAIIEIFTIVIGFSIFIIVWNSKRVIPDAFFLILGCSFLFTGILDLFHTLTYFGMEVFPGSTANLPTQLWIAARMFQCVTFLIATIYIGRSLTKSRIYDVEIITAVCSLIIALLLASIFVWKNFPTCYIPGVGLTSFKIVSEYIICLFFVASIVILYRKRSLFEADVRDYLIAGLVFMILGELAFTMYLDVYGFANMLGHLAKLIAYYFFYLAIIVVGLTRPYDLLFRDLIRSLNEVILMLDSSGNISYISPVVERLYGYPVEEIEGQPFAKLIHQDDRPRFWEIFRTREISRQKANEFRILNRNGKIQYVRISAGPMVQVGYLTAFPCTLTDISESKHSEEALRSSYQILDAILNSITVRVFWKDTHSVYLGCNAPLAKDAGFEKQEDIIGKTDYALSWKDYADSFRDDDREVLETGISKYLYEETRIGPDGKIHYLLTSKVPLKDSEGNIIGILGTYFDVTEKKQAENIVRANEKRLERSQDLGHIGSWEYNPVTMKVWGSHEGFRIYGLTPSPNNDLPIEDIEACIPERERVHQALIDLIERDIPYNLEFAINPADGSPQRIIRSVANVIRNDEGRLITIEGIIQDISDRKATEEELRKSRDELEKRVEDRTRELSNLNDLLRKEIAERNEAERKVMRSLQEKEILLREVHHRVKNNLQIIISLLHLQSRKITDREMLSLIKESENRVRVMALVHERLYHAKDFSKIDLSDFIGFMATNLFRLYGIRQSQITLNIEVTEIPVDIYRAIPIGLIINELLSNSMKYAFPDGRKGEIRVTGKREGGTISLTVEDNGVGIPGSVDWRNTESLGLRLVTGLTDQLRGTVSLDRASGTKFTLIIREDVTESES